ncbi:MAG: TetR/AcrR family transcriptional regulator [Chloroflexota bacterium]|nr:TetR/AcrR family transcriptional regulator [Chloroflexota bacterium]
MARQGTGKGRGAALTADDWVDAALRALAEGGVAAVAVEPIAQRLGVTKGSFYWHFANREALLRAALERWEEGATEAVIAALAPLRDPREWLVQLVEDAFTEETEVETAKRGGVASGSVALAVADAAEDPVVGPVLRRVSARRLAYLEECFRALGLTGEEARSRALLAYSAYIGVGRLAREAPDWVPTGKQLAAFKRHLIAGLLPEDGGDADDRRAVGENAVRVSTETRRG